MKVYYIWGILFFINCMMMAYLIDLDLLFRKSTITMFFIFSNTFLMYKFFHDFANYDIYLLNKHNEKMYEEIEKKYEEIIKKK